MRTKRVGNNARVLALDFNKAKRSHSSDKVNKFQNTKFNKCKNVLQAICCAAIYKVNYNFIGA